MNECSHDSNRLCCVVLTLLDFVRPRKCFNHISAVLDKVLEFNEIEKKSQILQKCNTLAI